MKKVIASCAFCALTFIGVNAVGSLKQGKNDMPSDVEVSRKQNIAEQMKQRDEARAMRQKRRAEWRADRAKKREERQLWVDKYEKNLKEKLAKVEEQIKKIEDVNVKAALATIYDYMKTNLETWQDFRKERMEFREERREGRTARREERMKQREEGRKVRRSLLLGEEPVK